LAICLVTAFLCYLLRGRKYLRFLPLVLLGLLFFSLYNLASLLMMVPPAGYVIWLTWKNEFEISHIEFKHSFSLYYKILGILLIISVPMSFITDTTNVLIMCLAYFVCGITLLRTLRHQESTQKESGFVLLNFIPGIAFVVGIFLLSSDLVVSAVAALFYAFRMALYYLFIVPFAFFLRLMGPMFGWLGPRNIDNIPQQPWQAGEPRAVDFDELIPPEDPTQIPFIIFYVVIGAAAIYVIIKLILILRKMMFKWEMLRSDENYSDITEEALQSRSGHWFPKFNRLSAIRRYYRRFLKLCRNQGMEIVQSHTSADIEDKAKTYVTNQADLRQLRDLYLRARYGGEELTKDDEKLARKAYRGIREVMK